MNYEVKYELDRLKELVKTKKVTDEFHMFLDESYYEDDYSGNEILEMQEELLYHAKKYLKENHSGKFAIQQGGDAVILITKERFDDMTWRMGWTLC